MPSGAPTATPMTLMISEPAIALSKPPAAPGGGVICVNTAGDRPLAPS